MVTSWNAKPILDTRKKQLRNVDIPLEIAKDDSGLNFAPTVDLEKSVNNQQHDVSEYVTKGAKRGVEPRNVGCAPMLGKPFPCQMTIVCPPNWPG